ncbi:MFS transporter [Cordyceps javanica]|uniref:MFS transporter n=1 Tax=Cordyceps javanica TaxID=43265 RepID=A0A545V6G3_9HYPO|nr:MFS transporter [Cordyceps javanica]TQW08549.1 MFS transporter [Cordyceps javanica]
MASAQQQRLPTTYGTISSAAVKMNTPDNTKGYDSDSGSDSDTVFSCDRQPKTQNTSREKTYWHPIIILLLMLMIDGFGYVMSAAPQTRLIEDIVCRKYYSAETLSTLGLTSPSEDMCKERPVQDAVAQLFGWQTFFDGIPGLVLAMYFGVLADKHGRRGVLFLSMLGQTIGLMWVLFIFAELIGPLVSSKLMQINLWIPILIGLGCTVVTMILAGSVPETLQPKAKTVEEDGSEDGPQGIQGRLSGTWKHISTTLRYIASNRSLVLLVVTFLVMDYSRQSLSVLLQYISTRYSLPIAKANYMLSFRAFAQLITFALILPALDTYMVKKLAVPPRRKDLRLCRASIMLIMTSFGLLVIAPRVWVAAIAIVFYTFGSGFGSFARSLASALVEKDMIGTLLTSVAIMDTTGSLLAGPIVAQTFSWSLNLDGVGRGLPYLCSFLLCGLATVALFQVRSVERPDEKPAPADEESQGFLDGAERASA